MDFASATPLSQGKENIPQSKKRRFAPNSGLSVLQARDNYNPANQRASNALFFQTSSPTPTQEEIERELFQVGMRIRRSVSEGYKTTAAMPFFNMHYSHPTTQDDIFSDTHPILSTTFSSTTLSPLSHLNSTHPPFQRQWTYSTTHKRRHDTDTSTSDSDNDQDFMPHTPKLLADEQMMPIPIDYFSINFDDSRFDEVSPLTDPYEMLGVASRAPPPLRKFAVPKSRRQHQQQSHMNGVQWMGHQRMSSCGVEAKMSVGGDFGEAGFLLRKEDVDMDWS